MCSSASIRERGEVSQLNQLNTILSEHRLDVSASVNVYKNKNQLSMVVGERHCELLYNQHIDLCWL